MPALEFFVLVMFVGIVLLGFGGMVGWRVRQSTNNVEERYNLRLTLELSLFTVVFALLPFPLVYLFSAVELLAWQFASLGIATFLGLEIMRIYYKGQIYRVRWTFSLISLLVLSGIFLTIELLNGLMWASLAVYTWGLLWLLTLSGIQFISFVLYEKAVRSRNTNTAFQQLQRDGGTDYSNGAPDYQPNRYRDPVEYAKRQRYAHRFPIAHSARPNRRSFTDSTSWADKNTR